jgi:hypothetical protein
VGAYQCFEGARASIFSVEKYPEDIGNNAGNQLPGLENLKGHRSRTFLTIMLRMFRTYVEWGSEDYREW